MKKVIVIAIISIFFFGTNIAFAGGLPNLGGLASCLSKGSSTDLCNLTSSRQQAIASYLAATKELSISLEKAAEAFGVKEEVLKKLAAVDALKEGNLSDSNIEKARKSSQEANEIIKQKMQSTKAPSIEDKKLMAESMIHLAVAAQKEMLLVKEVQNLSNQAQAAIKSASPMEIFKIKDIALTAFVLVKNVPMDLGLTQNILGSYIQYAKANNISVPSNATGLLKGD